MPFWAWDLTWLVKIFCGSAKDLTTETVSTTSISTHQQCPRMRKRIAVTIYQNAGIKTPRHL